MGEKIQKVEEKKRENVKEKGRKGKKKEEGGKNKIKRNFVYMEYLCRPSEASTRYCVIPSGYPPRD